MIPDPAREALIWSTAMAIREAVPAFQRGITWDEFRHALTREGIFLSAVPLGRPAKLMGHEGVWMILVDCTRPERHLWYALHEYAHFKLHVERLGEGRYETCYHMDDVMGDDPREAEADLLADLLLSGPRFPAVAALHNTERI